MKTTYGRVFEADDEYAIKETSEDKHEFRSDFDRDRDRLLYSKEFRRLSGKTQVFIAGFDDNARTRLTHTLEVSQIAKTIAKFVQVNETLTEAISIGHDIGHTPFGHVGERTLNHIMNGCDIIKEFNINLPALSKGFKHNWQGVRVVTELEKRNRDYAGLNLTNFTIWGILNHSKTNYGECDYLVNDTCNLRHQSNKCDKSNPLLGYYDKYKKFINEKSWTIEALIVREADEIAQRHHDIEDGIEAKIINRNELIMKFKELFDSFLTREEKKLIERIEKEKNKTYFLSLFSTLIVNFYTTQLIKNTIDRLTIVKEEFNVIDNKDFHNKKSDIAESISNRRESIFDLVSYSKSFDEKEKEFQKYLRSRILYSHLAQSMDGKANYIIRNLFKAYLTNPQQLPDTTIYAFYKSYLDKTDWKNIVESEIEDNVFISVVGELRDKLQKDHFQGNTAEYKQTLLRTICDYIAGMTDKYAYEQFEFLYGSQRVLRL